MWLGARLAPLVGSSSIPTPLNVAHLSHDPTVEKTLATDPLCREQVGSLKGVADMLTGGRGLVERDWRNWPKDLPVRLR
jgi:acylglycerol lipase